jgi:hypothetical protein
LPVFHLCMYSADTLHPSPGIIFTKTIFKERP